VDSLEVFRTRITDTIQEWNDFWVARGEGIRKLKVAYRLRRDYMEKNGDERKNHSSDSVEKSLGEMSVQITRLRDQEAQFKAIYEKTLTLREGVRHLNFLAHR
jgi:hypothetical protein